MRAEELAQILGGHREGDQFKAPCPAHPDTKPSLAIKDGRSGKLLLHCHAGCTYDEILAALQRKGIDVKAESELKARELFDSAAPATEQHPYLQSKGLRPGNLRQRDGWLLAPFEDEHGELVGVERICARRQKFFQGRRKGAAYVALQPSNGELLVLCEGVADALAVSQKLAIPAAAAGGIQNLRAASETLIRRYRDARLVLLPDGDAEGRKQGEAVALAFRLPLARLPDDSDPAELIARGADADVATAIQEARVPSAPGGCEVIRADRVRPKQVDWIWPGWLARGELHILGGWPGSGKTTVALDLVARATRGGPFPDGEPCPPMSALIVTGEDSLAQTIRPRLDAAGAVLKRVHVLDATQTLSNPAVLLATLERQDLAVDILVIDPIAVALDARVDSHKYQEMRLALTEIVKIAHRLGIAVLGITHVTKSTRSAEPVGQLIGSIATGAAARLVWMTCRNVGPGWRLVRAKSNLGAEGDGFIYQITEGRGPKGSPAACITWQGSLGGTPVELLSEASDRSTRLREAVRFLEDMLADGPMPSKDLYDAAEKEGIAMNTLRRAQQQLGVRRRRRGYGADGSWWCELPEQRR